MYDIVCKPHARCEEVPRRAKLIDAFVEKVLFLVFDDPMFHVRPVALMRQAGLADAALILHRHSAALDGRGRHAQRREGSKCGRRCRDPETMIPIAHHRDIEAV